MEFVFLIYAILISAQLKPLIIIAGEVMLGPEDIVTNPLILKLWHFELLMLLNQQKNELLYWWEILISMSFIIISQ